MDVTLLTQADCAFCDQAKDVLVRLADEYPLTLREVDLSSAEGRTLAERADVMFAPGVLVNGEVFSYGRLSERKLRRKLERAR